MKVTRIQQWILGNACITKIQVHHCFFKVTGIDTNRQTLYCEVPATFHQSVGFWYLNYIKFASLPQLFAVSSCADGIRKSIKELIQWRAATEMPKMSTFSDKKLKNSKSTAARI